MSTVLVTGANRGLGLEFARQYLQRGWTVLAGCRKPERAMDLQQLANDGRGVRLFQLDVLDAASVKRAATELADQPLDLLLNVAGVMGNPAALGRIDYDAWGSVLEANTLGPVRVLEAFLPQLLGGERKVAVAITSGMGSIGDNTSGGYLPYRTSKAALNMAMKTLALELAPRGVTCIVMNPGWVRTDMGGSSAPLEPRQSIAAMIRVIEGLEPSANGRFLNYDGREYEW